MKAGQQWGSAYTLRVFDPHKAHPAAVVGVRTSLESDGIGHGDLRVT